jgi:hypothetical protein
LAFIFVALVVFFAFTLATLAFFLDALVFLDALTLFAFAGLAFFAGLTFLTDPPAPRWRACSSVVWN